MISVVIPASNKADAIGEAVRQIEGLPGQVEHEAAMVACARQSGGKA